MSLRQRMPKSKEADHAEPPSAIKPDIKLPKPARPRQPLPRPGRHRIATSRIHVALSAIAIGLFFAVSGRFSLSKKALPDAWALCSRPNRSAIYTVADGGDPTVECIVLHKKYVRDSGSLKEIRARWGDKDITGPIPGAPEVAAKTGLKFFWLKDGQAAYPGFSDAHAHVLEYGATRELNLVGAESIEEVRQRIRTYILSKPELINDTSTWIRSQGWDQNRFPGGQYPSAADLDEDELLKGRPISLSRVDVHASWVSPKVLETLGPLPEKVDGGLIIRDAENRPTGIFVDNAMSLVETITPPWTEAQSLRHFQITVKEALAHGLTSIHDAWSLPGHIKLFKSLADKGALPIRLNVMARIDSEEYWGDQLERLVGYADDYLNVRSVKLVMDGALGSWGAALLEPYSDQPGNRGLMLVSTATINEHVRRFVEDGWQTNVHCIGDRANHEVLDAFEKAFLNTTARDAGLRHRIEHAQILTQDDLKRIGKLGIIASIQPTHATSDMGYAETRLGPERIKGAYAWRTLIENDVRIALGSDFPVEGINPLLGFYAGVSRLDIEGNSPHGDGGWYPEQRLTREEALRGMTLDAAYAAHQEDILGSLVAGKRADIVILDKDIMNVPVADILTTKVVATLVDGTIMYGGIS